MNDSLQKKLGLLELGLTLKLASIIIWYAGFAIGFFKPQTVISIVVFVSVADMVGSYFSAYAPIGGLGSMVVRLSMMINLVGTVVSLGLLASSIMQLAGMPALIPLSPQKLLMLDLMLVLADAIARLCYIIFLTCLAAALREGDSQTKAGISSFMLIAIYVLAAMIVFGYEPNKNVWPLAALIPMVPLSFFYMERYMSCLYDLKQAVSMAQMKAAEQANMPEPL